MKAGAKEREREKESRRENEWRTRSAKGWKAGCSVTMRPAGGWGLLDLFEDQEEDVEEARETQTVVGREERRLQAGTSEVRCALIALIALNRPCSIYRGAPTLLASRVAVSTASNDSGDTGPENARSGRTDRSQ